MDSSLGFAYLTGLSAVVAFGSVVPVLPTGAAVTVAAALGGGDPLVFLTVVGFGAVGAYIGDLALYGLLRLAGAPLALRMGWLQEGYTAETMARLRRGVESHQVAVLVTCRLVPAGRVPVLVAAALGGYSWRRYAAADVFAALLWSLMYAAMGAAGRAAFREAWQGAVVAGLLAGLIGLGSRFWTRRRQRSSRTGPTAEAGQKRAVLTPRQVASDPRHGVAADARPSPGRRRHGRRR